MPCDCPYQNNDDKANQEEHQDHGVDDWQPVDLEHVTRLTSSP